MQQPRWRLQVQVEVPNFQCVPEINALLTEMNWYWVNLERWRREFYLIRKRRPRPTVSQAGTVVGLIRHSQAKYSQNG
jgi:hypothetical protein